MAGPTTIPYSFLLVFADLLMFGAASRLCGLNRDFIHLGGGMLFDVPSCGEQLSLDFDRDVSFFPRA